MVRQAGFPSFDWSGFVDRIGFFQGYLVVRVGSSDAWELGGVDVDGGDHDGDIFEILQSDGSRTVRQLA